MDFSKERETLWTFHHFSGDSRPMLSGGPSLVRISTWKRRGVGWNMLDRWMMRPGARAALGRPTTSTHQNKEPLAYPDSRCVQIYPVFKIFAGHKQNRHIHWSSWIESCVEASSGRLHEPPAGTWRHPILLSANVQHVQCVKWAITACILIQRHDIGIHRNDYNICIFTYVICIYISIYYKVHCNNRLWLPWTILFSRWYHSQ